MVKTSGPSPQTSLVLFHCRFADYGLCDHRAYSFELQTYLTLPHLYAICAIDDSCRPERMISGLLVKTDIRYEDPRFLESMAAAFQAVPAFRKGLHENTSLLPAPIDVESPRPLTEDQALIVFKQLWAEHVAAQSRRQQARFR
jgi:hypothetical protein